MVFKGKERRTSVNCELTDLHEKIARLEEKLFASESSLRLAREAIEKRLEGMNEFREQLRQQSGTFLTKETYEGRHEAIQVQVDDLRISKALLEGKASQNSVNISLGFAIVSLVLGLVNIFKSFL